jgi:hypothetical protein
MQKKAQGREKPMKDKAQKAEKQAGLPLLMICGILYMNRIEKEPSVKKGF